MKNLIVAATLAAALTVTGCTATSTPTAKPTSTTAKTADSAVTPAEKNRLDLVEKLDREKDGTEVNAKEYSTFRLSPSDTSRTPYLYTDLTGKTRVFHAYSMPGDSGHVRQPVQLPRAVIDDLQKRLDDIPEPTLDDGATVSQKLVELTRSLPDPYHPTFVLQGVLPPDASEPRRLNWLAVTKPSLSSSGDFVDSLDEFVGESDDRDRLLAGTEAHVADLARKAGTGIDAFPVIAQNR